MKRHLTVYAAVLALALCVLPGCAGCAGCAMAPPPPARDVLEAMLEAMPGTMLPAKPGAKPETAGALPAGEVYDRTADPAGRTYLSDALFAALYGPAARGRIGGGELPEVMTEVTPEGIPDGSTGDSPEGEAEPAMIADAAVFLSLREHPGEMAVMRCADADGALTAAALCRLRLDSLRTAWQGTAYAFWTEHADVTVEGCYVLMAVVPDPEVVFDAARRVIDGR